MAVVDFAAVLMLCVWWPGATAPYTRLSSRALGAYVVLLMGLTAPIAGRSLWLRAAAPFSSAQLELPDGTFQRLVQGDDSAPDVVDGRLHLRNAGAEPLHFDLTVSCGCLNVVPQSGVIPPEAAISVSFQVSLGDLKYRGAKIYVASNDPDHPQQVVDLMAERRACARASPSVIDFQNVPLGEKVVKKIVLHPLKESFRELVLTSSGRARYGRVAVTKAEHTDDGYAWAVTWQADDISVLSDVVEIIAEDAIVIAEIPVQGSALPVLQISPSTISLAAADATAYFRLIRTDGHELPRELKWHVPAGFALEEVRVESRSQRLFALRPQDTSNLTTPTSARLSVHADSSSQHGATLTVRLPAKARSSRVICFSITETDNGDETN